jgi:hypothetical protein
VLDVKCEWLLEGSGALTSAGRIKKFSFTPLSLWIIKAWQHISADVRLQGIGSCCISHAMDGSDEWNDIEEAGYERSVRKTRTLMVKMDILKAVKVDK